MASPKDTSELPIVWLVPPDTLLPSHYSVKVHPAPIAVSVTLASLIILVLVVVYNRKPQNTNVLHIRLDDVFVKGSTTNFELKETTQQTASSSSFPMIQSQGAENGGIALQEQSPSILPSRDIAPAHMMYHEHLFDSRYGPYRQSCISTGTSFSIDSYYHTLADRVDVLEGSNNNVCIDDTTNHSNPKPAIITAASSNYSVSTCEAVTDVQNLGPPSPNAPGT